MSTNGLYLVLGLTRYEPFQDPYAGDINDPRTDKAHDKSYLIFVKTNFIESNNFETTINITDRHLN